MKFWFIRLVLATLMLGLVFIVVGRQVLGAPGDMLRSSFISPVDDKNLGSLTIDGVSANEDITAMSWDAQTTVPDGTTRSRALDPDAVPCQGTGDVGATGTWVKIGLAGVNVLALAASPTYAIDHTLLAGTYLNGICYSHDSGQTWHSASSTVGWSVLALAMSPAFATDQTAFASLYKYGVNGGIGDAGVFRSTDGGETWQLAMEGFGENKFSNDLVFSPNYVNDHKVFAATVGTYNWIFRSSNGGETWEAMSTGDGSFDYFHDSFSDLAVSPAYATDHTLFGGSSYGSGVWRSTDDGHSWQSMSRVFPPPECTCVGQVAVSPAYSADHTLFVALFGDGAARSMDGGQTWELISESLADPTVFSIALSPAYALDRALFAGGVQAAGVIYHSTDGGDTWEALNDGLYSANFVIYAPDGTAFVGGDGVYRWNSPSEADLSITKTDSPDPVTVVGNLTYTIVVKNSGPSQASGVTVTDALPSNVTFVSASSTHGACAPAVPPLPANRTVRCAIGALGNTESATVTLVVKPTMAGMIANTASVAGNESDPNMANNTTPPINTLVEARSQKEVIVFLEGIGTDLKQKEIDAMKGPCSDTSNDLAFGDIKLALTELDLVCGDFLRYSYNNGYVDVGVNREWHPNPYTCEHTGQSLDKSISNLRFMLGEYRRAHAQLGEDVHFVLIGHSLGGVIALETTKFIGRDRYLPPGSIAAIVTVDSPLNNLSRWNLESTQRVAPLLAKLPCAVVGDFGEERTGGGGLLLYSKAAKQLANVRNDSERQRVEQKKEAFVAAGQAKRAKFMTIGNIDDCVWYLTHCGANWEMFKIYKMDKDWEDDRPTMWIGKADKQGVYGLGKGGCDFSGGITILNLPCLVSDNGPHHLALHDQDVIRDITQFVSSLVP